MQQHIQRIDPVRGRPPVDPPRRLERPRREDEPQDDPRKRKRDEDAQRSPVDADGHVDVLA